MRFRIIAKIIIVTILAASTAWGIGLYDFYNQIATNPTTNTAKTDAIIVLTGGQDRIAEGVKLLNHGFAGKMLISGVSKSTRFEEMLEQQNLPVAEVKNIDAKKIAVGREAINTVGNAVETADWVKANNIKSIRLVTANYHMPRSLTEFRKKMPDLVIIENPVIPHNFTRNNWRSDEFTRRFILAEYTKYLMAQVGR